ncbi:DUF861 domain-containing protein [Roseovarius sp. LXJ103]|uniref:cupin domain-containing protein n=1 Tax=Roseovarius carneus TaxID=2853164 RepID=UPI000D61C60F|nr:cupin domain-containing protein [Roseovarius carneus]MBZ8117641.1 DUF861 domain-containing protein [Roseovarius carneus]PWE36576.1 hypothetical protein DD563_11780 [Pelagicola sp. LXJ1103]
MTNQASIIRLEANGPGGAGLKPMTLNAADFQSPLPNQHSHSYYSDESKGINVGVWDTTTMQEAFGPYPGDEFIWVLEGAFEMTDGKGGSVPARAGQAVCFRNGAPVSWKQDGYLKKFFITYLEPGAKTPKIESAEGGIVVLDPDAKMDLMDTTDPFVIKGAAPKQHNLTSFTNDTGNMFMGQWDSGPMISEMRPFPTHEFVQMLEGEVTITEDTGAEQTFRAGDCFFVPKGTVCSWEIPDYVRKFYCILDVGSDA